ncbi:dehydrogenase/reductase SDR family member 7 [Planococcus citri]|uniref:dehydrogenase/reductase SDR family member 7 n=1 Tax=Planococcus citri TaxID=170843 RepID=UPI0031F83F69
MDIFSAIGAAFLLYVFSYTAILLVSDCDVRLLFASIFGRRKLREFKGKVVWITGASSGIGEYIAVALASHGAKLVLTARNEVELQRVKTRCLESGKLSPEDVLVLPMDITDVSRHQSSFDKVLQHFNQVDILINNAGRSQRATWEQIELQVDREMFELNVFSNVNLSRMVSKYFLEGKGGHIVLTSSIAGLMPVPFSPTYSATKFALHGYYGSLFREKAGKNIKVTILCPGPVFSNLLPACFTNVAGEKFGETHSSNDSRMTTERCAFLSIIAIANNLYEVWMAKFPLLFITYLGVYCPNFSLWMFKRVGTNMVQRLRDNRVTVQNP